MAEEIKKKAVAAEKKEGPKTVKKEFKETKKKKEPQPAKEVKEKKTEKKAEEKTEKTEKKPIKKEEKKPKATKEELMEANTHFLHPLISEKAINVIEKENKITFIVNKGTTKSKIKKAFETLYDAKAEKVNIIKDMKGRKKAIVKLGKEYKAENIATKLGII